MRGEHSFLCPCFGKAYLVSYPLAQQMEIFVMFKYACRVNGMNGLAMDCHRRPCCVGFLLFQ